MTGRRLILAICIGLASLGIGRAEILPNGDRHSENALAQARDLFLANRLSEALRTLDEQTLARSAKANLLAGLMPGLYLGAGGLARRLGAG